MYHLANRLPLRLFLRLEPPTGVIVTQKYILIRTLQSTISFSSIPTLILPVHRVPQDAYNNYISDEVTQTLTRAELSRVKMDHWETPYRAVSNEVPRAPFRSVQLRPKNSSNISNRNLHRVRSRSLRLTRNIIRRPAQDDCNGGPDARGNYDRPRIRHSRPAAGEEHYIPNDPNGGTANDERRPSLRLLR